MLHRNPEKDRYEVVGSLIRTEYPLSDLQAKPKPLYIVKLCLRDDELVRQFMQFTDTNGTAAYRPDGVADVYIARLASAGKIEELLSRGVNYGVAYHDVEHGAIQEDTLVELGREVVAKHPFSIA